MTSPYINRFLSADSIVLGYANPQNLNRFSYVNNNPLRFTDPTGHWADEGCGTGGLGGGTGCKPPSTPLPSPNDSGNYCSTHSGACGGGGPTSPIEIPGREFDIFDFSSETPNYFGTPGPNFCDLIPNPNSTTFCQPKPDWLTQTYYPPYDPNNSLFAQYSLSAFMGGASGGYGAGAFTPVGIEALIMMQDGKPDLSGFGYFGQGVGGGAEASLYGGVVFNLDTPDDYRGDFMTYNFTFEPISLSYFHDASSKILQPGAVQGFSIGKGFGISISGTNTNFSKGFELKWP